MKILKITFQNLNSLKGEHIIDLENGLLSEAGIFSITGPTGAGKSTILDAITLALFGKAARYEKDSNPGEMMTRGTGQCTAEVLFQCAKGRYTSKWTRTRSRNKPDGKLQNPKREIAKSPSGEILAEKLREADLLIETLTGLDYHRFLRSVLLAQGRFKEFLDAGDNERGELLEKITGTEIYSLISQKAFEFENTHQKQIQEARQKLDNVELQTEETLTALNQEKAEKEAAIQKLKTTLNTLHTKLQLFQNHRTLSETRNLSNQQLLKYQQDYEAFKPSLQQLTQHEATQPFQTALIELQNQQRQQHAITATTADLREAAHRARTTAAHQLAATIQALSATKTDRENAIAEAETLLSKTEKDQQSIAHWIKENQEDQNIESQLPEIRTLGEAIRLADKELKRLLSEKAELENSQLENKTQLATKKAHLQSSLEQLTKANDRAKNATEIFTQATAGKTLDDWRNLAKQHTKQEITANSLNTQRQQWTQVQASLKNLTEQLAPLEKRITAAQEARKSQELIVAKETAILEDKQTIYDQARLIATLEDQRKALKPKQECPLCGSLEHPFSDHLTHDEATEKQALAVQKQTLSAAETTLKATLETLSRLDEKQKSLLHNIAQTTTEVEEQAKALRRTATAAGYAAPIESDEAFSAWQSELHEQSILSEKKLSQLSRHEETRQKAHDIATELAAAHKISTLELQNTEEKEADFLKKLEINHHSLTKARQSIQTHTNAFNHQLGENLPPALVPAETETRTQALEQKLRHYKSQTEAHAALQNRIQELLTTLKEQRTAKTRLSEELQTWEEKLTSFSEISSAEIPAHIAIAESESKRRHECQTALDAAHTAQQALQQKQKDASQLASEIQKATTTLEETLRNSPFKSIEALTAARLTDSQASKLISQKNALKTQHDKLDGQITQTTEALRNIESQGVPTPDEAAALKITSSENDEKISAQNKRLGEITLLIEQDKNARLSQVQQIEHIKTLEKSARPWIELNNMIGSSNGVKFSKFAQGLTLAQLIQLANRHLLELNDRYIIQRTPESELSLEIIDRYQADAIRPTRSLSGGESFLVSLALALGLSDLAGSDTRIESLFIDEGFGTLDTATLDTALAALENLRMSNRTIGIISHVDALKQRISAQIRVEKATNGYGTLTITNGA